MSEYQTCDLLIEAIDEESGGPLTKEGVELVRKGWEHGQAAMEPEITTLRQQLADVTGCACNSEGPCKYHAMTSVSGRSYVLRKQAEAAEEAIVCALRTVGNVDPFEVNIHKFANDYAQRLRQQADEADRAGGEK